VLAREVDGRTLYVNTTQAPITVSFDGVKTGVLSHKRYAGAIALAPYGVELVK
jgi:beta-galactosidase